MDNDNSVVKVIDFGFSTCFSHEKKVKLFCGTPTYMAPEIVMRKEYSGPPADIWALGVLLFVMLSGCFPFKAPTDRELFKKIEKGIFSIPSHVTAGARNLIHKILLVNPDERLKASDILSDNWLNEGRGQMLEDI
jgi:serine/threonine protein kinase